MRIRPNICVTRDTTAEILATILCITCFEGAMFSLNFRSFRRQFTSGSFHLGKRDEIFHMNARKYSSRKRDVPVSGIIWTGPNIKKPSKLFFLNFFIFLFTSDRPCQLIIFPIESLCTNFFFQTFLVHECFFISVSPAIGPDCKSPSLVTYSTRSWACQFTSWWNFWCDIVDVGSVQLLQVLHSIWRN
jgi:hypothetical protein